MLLKIVRGFIFLNVLLAIANLPCLATDKEELQCAGDACKQKHYDEAFNRLHKMAARGHTQAQCLVGLMYQEGLGCKKDAHLAASWYQKSARKGFADAQSRLGQMYLTGQEIKKDTAQAEIWLGKAAKNGVAEAQLNLGRMYLHGDGFHRNEQKARRWLLLARDQGVEDAENLLHEIPGYDNAASSVGARARKVSQNYSNGIGNIEQSWEGYGDIVKSMRTADQLQ